MKKLAAALVCTVILTGCATPKMIDREQYTDFKKGVTTYSDVVKRLGEPNGRQNQASGAYSVTYNSTSSKVDPKSYIPIVGAFIGGVETKGQMLTFSFDKNNRLIDYLDTVSSSRM